MKRKYEEISITLLQSSLEGTVLLSSGEQSDRMIDPVNVDVVSFSKETVGEKTFDLDLK